MFGWIMKVLRGMLIGTANLIPGVSGGTMMVSMGVYDTIIYSVNHLFKEFKKCISMLLPYAIGMAAALLLGAFGLKAAFANFPLPTNTLFIGLILGSVPMIFSNVQTNGIGKKKTGISVALFIAFFALVVLLKVFEAENEAEITVNFGNMILFMILGIVASGTMVIPGVSGSMMLKTLGYYEPIYTDGVTGLVTALANGDWANVGHYSAILVPFLIGIVIGIFAVAKLIEVLLKRWEGFTYAAILGMVLASPVVILMNPDIYGNLSAVNIIVSAITLVLGCFISLKLGNEKKEENA